MNGRHESAPAGAFSLWSFASAAWSGCAGSRGRSKLGQELRIIHQGCRGGQHTALAVQQRDEQRVIEAPVRQGTVAKAQECRDLSRVCLGGTRKGPAVWVGAMQSSQIL